MRRWLVVVGVLCSSCGGSSPTAPSSTPPVVVVPPPPPTPITVTLTGHLVATNGGQPLSGLQTTLIGQSTTTDSSGSFRYTLTPAVSAVLSVTGASIVPRSLLVAANTSRDVTVDAISTAGFDLTYYRSLVRNGFEAPTVLQPIRRWTRTPMIYLKTVDEAGVAIDVTTIDTVERALKESVPEWTGGRLGVPAIERGTATREGQSGWLTVRFPAQFTEEGFCGHAQVGVDGGWVELYYTRLSSAATRCRLGRDVIASHVVKHEMGHALGFYHTNNSTDIMYTLGSWYSPTGRPSARELTYATIAYQRPVGNTDPDTDGPGNVSLAPMSVR